MLNKFINSTSHPGVRQNASKNIPDKLFDKILKDEVEVRGGR